MNVDVIVKKNQGIELSTQTLVAVSLRASQPIQNRKLRKLGDYLKDTASWYLMRNDRVLT